MNRKDPVMNINDRRITSPDSPSLCARLVREITDHLRVAAGNGKACIALSGGNTPLPLFRELASAMSEPRYRDVWSRVHFFWVDERCVPPGDAESNYGMARRYLFEKAGFAGGHIHRVAGENNPDEEAERYAGEVKRIVPLVGGVPSFDWMLLGLGSDGHTASLFPDRMDLARSDNLTEHVRHPQSGQSRITMTPKLINNAARISFLVTGASKRAILQALEDSPDHPAAYPSQMIRPLHGVLDWWMDEEAALFLGHGK